MNKTKVNHLYDLANSIAGQTLGFFDKKGPGKGNHVTNKFINTLRKRAEENFGVDYSEKNICGKNSLSVDYYFPEEGVVVEIALSLQNPNSEYEKDIFKVLIAKKYNYKVKRLLFISKPGGNKQCLQPGRSEVKKWVEKNYDIVIDVKDLIPKWQYYIKQQQLKKESKMFEILEGFFSIVIFVTSVYLIISGVSKKEKYLSAGFIKKRNLIFGIVLIVATLLSTDWNDMKNGLIDGSNVRNDVQVDTASK